mgnify:CR=1 FL=1
MITNYAIIIPLELIGNIMADTPPGQAIPTVQVVQQNSGSSKTIWIVLGVIALLLVCCCCSCVSVTLLTSASSGSSSSTDLMNTFQNDFSY